MSAPASPHNETDPARQVAELTELLAFLTSSWDEERRLLARQLHDSLGSSMTALTMHLGLLARQLPDEKGPRDRVEQMKQLLATIIETNRAMQLALWNDKLEFLGARAAIAELVSEFGREHGVNARASLPEEDTEFSRAQGVALLRCAEEGLRNVARHAKASQVDLILDDDGEQIMLTVRDDGVGPGATADADALGSTASHGLRLLRERARALDGTLTLGPGPEGGAALVMILPKAAPADA